MHQLAHAAGLACFQGHPNLAADSADPVHRFMPVTVLVLGSLIFQHVARAPGDIGAEQHQMPFQLRRGVVVQRQPLDIHPAIEARMLDYFGMAADGMVNVR